MADTTFIYALVGMNRPGIYQIRNLLTGIRYVGQSADVAFRLKHHLLRLRRNKHGNKHLQASWQKHGEAAFAFESLAIVEPSLLTLFEQRAFDALNSKYGCYNQGPFLDNAMRGRVHSDETRAKMSAAGKGKTKSETHRLAIGQAQIGKTIPADVRAKISAARKGRPGSRLGAILSETTRAKISAAHIGQPSPYKGMTGRYSKASLMRMSNAARMRSHPKHSEETKVKMSLARQRYYASPGTRDAASLSQRKSFQNPERRRIQSEATKKWWAQRKAGDAHGSSL